VGVFYYLWGMKTYLWLDDLRNPNQSVWYDHYIPELDKSVDSLIWVKEFPMFVDYINEFGLPDKIFFDHDLGEDKNGTGYDAAKWLVDYCMENGEIDVPDWGIQSANPVGRDNINSLLKNYRKHLNL
jgi:hypothetical protein